MGRKLTLKVRFWHFLTNWCSPYSQNAMVSFGHVDSWAGGLHFGTGHLWNSATELILINMYISPLSSSEMCKFTKRVEQYLYNQILLIMNLLLTMQCYQMR